MQPATDPMNWILFMYLYIILSVLECVYGCGQRLWIYAHFAHSRHSMHSKCNFIHCAPLQAYICALCNVHVHGMQHSYSIHRSSPTARPVPANTTTSSEWVYCAFPKWNPWPERCSFIAPAACCNVSYRYFVIVPRKGQAREEAKKKKNEANLCIRKALVLCGMCVAWKWRNRNVIWIACTRFQNAIDRFFVRNVVGCGVSEFGKF